MRTTSSSSFCGVVESVNVVAAPVLGLWLVSPLVAWWLSRPLAEPTPRLSAAQQVFLGKLSRRTWRYFEDFVTAEENWLPPDNYQEKSESGVASPRASEPNTPMRATCRAESSGDRRRHSSSASASEIMGAV